MNKELASVKGIVSTKQNVAAATVTTATAATPVISEHVVTLSDVIHYPLFGMELSAWFYLLTGVSTLLLIVINCFSVKKLLSKLLTKEN